MDFCNRLEGLSLASLSHLVLMSVGETRSLPQSGAPKALERLAREKHSSLLQKSVNYGHKKFIVQAQLMMIIRKLRP
jgi:hypothetical protein